MKTEFYTFIVGGRRVIALADAKHMIRLRDTVIPPVFPNEDVGCRPASPNEQGAYQIINRLFPTDEPLVLNA